jgi:hypothetical protein
MGRTSPIFPAFGLINWKMLTCVSFEGSAIMRSMEEERADVLVERSGATKASAVPDAKATTAKIA